MLARCWQNASALLCSDLPTAVFIGMLEYLQHSMQLTSKSQSYIKSIFAFKCNDKRHDSSWETKQVAEFVKMSPNSSHINSDITQCK